MKKFKNQLFCLIVLIIYSVTSLAQGGNTGNSPGVTNNLVGWDGTGSPALDLTIENAFTNKNIDFKLFNGTLIRRMTLLYTGQLGIGSFVPTYKLDIDSGDININFISRGYRIGGSGISNSDYVLWHNGIIDNIYVGVGAGNLNATNSNTFCGYQTGSNTGNTLVSAGDGTRNTFVGHVSGLNNDRGSKNSFYGDSSGYDNAGGDTTGYQNTFLGASSGRKNVVGKSNTLYPF